MSKTATERNFRQLDAREVVATLELLVRRIQERFPDSSLQRVCLELLAMGREAHRRAAWIRRPHWALRGLVAGVILGILAALLQAVRALELPETASTLAEFAQIADAGLNSLVYIGAALLFLVTVEGRIKRGRAQAALHELRAMAHVVDMHQLHKDPYRVLPGAARTPSSPEVAGDAFLMSRYLDYCSEMLALIGKLAALYAQDCRDPAVLASVDELESLTADLSRKIWQKIALLAPSLQPRHP